MIQRVSEFLATRRLMSFLISALAILLVADSGRRVAPDHAEADVLTWIALSHMVLAGIVTLVLPRLVHPSVRQFVAWGVGFSPFLYGFAAVMAGSPTLLTWVGCPRLPVSDRLGRCIRSEVDGSQRRVDAVFTERLGVRSTKSSETTVAPCPAAISSLASAPPAPSTAQ
jgi:hypothetical protein